MELQVWTLEQLSEVEKLVREKNIPIDVIRRIETTLKILDNVYGTERDQQGKNSKGEGGYVLVGTVSLYQKEQEILKDFGIYANEVEFEEDVASDYGIVWKEKLYLVDNDYGIVFFYPIGGNED